MLQDALKEHVEELTNYIENPLFKGVYRGETLDELKKLRTASKRLLARAEADAVAFEAKEKAKAK